MSVFARYKSQKFVKSDSTACDNCELRVKKFSLIGIGCFFFLTLRNSNETFSFTCNTSYVIIENAFSDS